MDILTNLAMAFYLESGGELRWEQDIKDGYSGLHMEPRYHLGAGFSFDATDHIEVDLGYASAICRPSPAAHTTPSTSLTACTWKSGSGRFGRIDMPTYAYACPACAKQAEEFRHVDERHNGPMCCGKPMVIEIRPAYAQPDLPGYESPVTGEWVEGRAARRADLAKAGSRPSRGRAAGSQAQAGVPRARSGPAGRTDGAPRVG